MKAKVVDLKSLICGVVLEVYTTDIIDGITYYNFSRNSNGCNMWYSEHEVELINES